MKIKTRYIISQFGIHFIFSFLIFFFIFTLNSFFQLIDILIKGSFHFFNILKFFLLTDLIFLQYIIPLSFFSSGLSLFSTITVDREIYVFEFSGISKFILIKKCLFFVVLSILFLYPFNFYLIPNWKFRQRNLKSELKLKNPLTLIIEKEIVKEIPGITIYVEKVGRDFSFQNISITKKEKEITFFLKAEKGKAKFYPDENKIIFKLQNGHILTSFRDNVSSIEFKEYFLPVVLPEGFKRKKLEPRISELSLNELVKFNKIDSQVEIHKRFTYTLSPLFLFILGAGIGIKLKQKSKVIIVGSGGLVSVGFFELLTLGEIIARKFGIPYTVYTPLIIFAIIGKRLLR